MKLLFFLAGILVSLVPQASGARSAKVEEYLIVVQGKPTSDRGWLQFPDVDGRPARVSINALSDTIQATILEAREVRVLLWQIRSGDVSDPNGDGWFCEPVTIGVEGRLVFDGRFCAVHHTRLMRVTKWAAHGDIWERGDLMSAAARASFPHGLPFVILGQMFPSWQEVRSYSCEQCVEARERWERAYEIMKRPPNQPLEPTPTAGTSAAEQPLVPAAVVAHL